MTDQIERILHYETLLNEAASVLRRYEAALDAFVSVQEMIAELNEYYTGDEWKRDFEASERGELPEDLPCGILSEDGIDHLLLDNRELQERTASVAEEIKNTARDTD